MNHRIKFALRVLIVIAAMGLVVWIFIHVQASEGFP